MNFEPANPYTTDWRTWACDVTEQLSSYNAPSPGAEDSWLFWAEYISTIPELAELGVQDPRGFASWRDWGASILQTV